MRAVQISELSGPESALKLVDLPEPEPSHPLTPGSGRRDRRPRRRRVVPRGAADARRVPDQARPAVRARQRGGRHGAQRAGGLRAQRGRPRGRAAACSAGSPRSPSRPTSSPSRCSDELDFAQGAGLILNYHTAYFSLKHARPAAGGRDRARARRGGRRRHRDAPGGQGPRRAHDRGRVERRQGAGRARGGRRRGRPLRRAVEGRGEGASGGGVDIVIDPVGGDRFTDSLRSLREDGAARGRRLHRRLDPRGEGQPAAAQQPRGRRRRLGRLRDGQAAT